MKDLKKLYEECSAEVKAAGIKQGIVKSVYSKETGHALGRTNAYNCGTPSHYYTISINPNMLADDIPEKRTKEVIIHEICHTVDDCFEHGKNWKRITGIMNDKYGYEITTKADLNKLGIGDVIQYKYKFKCEGCGQIVGFNRKSKFVQNYKNYRCQRCLHEFEKVGE